MEILINIVGFIGMWCLFSFPLYQAFLELSAQAISFSKQANQRVQVKEVPKRYWLWPPLKIRKEKERALVLIKTMHLNETELKQLLVYLDKATAWFYVSLAGLFNGIYFTYDLYSSQSVVRSPWFFLAIVLFMVAICIGNVVYRLSEKRNRLKINQLKNL